MKRVVGWLAMAGLGCAALLPGVGHGCGMAVGFAVEPTTATHHNHHNSDAPDSPPRDCKCVGMSCASTLAVVTAGASQVNLEGPAEASPGTGLHSDRITFRRPPHTLPFAHAPPASLS